MTINPYYEFAVSELTPRRQTIPWRRQAAEATVSIANLGNSDATFNLEGRDDERGCSYEFEVPGEQIALTGAGPPPLII